MLAHRDRATKALDPSNSKPTEERYQLQNSIVTLEHGPAGPIARIVKGERTEYAGPLPQETIRAIEEVATDGE